MLYNEKAEAATALHRLRLSRGAFPSCLGLTGRYIGFTTTDQHLPELRPRAEPMLIGCDPGGTAHQ